MIKNIIDTLQLVEGETENIRIAQGKNKLAKSFSESAKQIKRNKIWGKK